MRRALAICEAALGPDHPDTRGSRQSLAVIQQKLSGEPSAEAQQNPPDALIALIADARQGNQEAGRQAWGLTQQLAQSDDETLASLGRALQNVLAGEDPQTALAPLPDDLRSAILAVLN